MTTITRHRGRTSLALSLIAALALAVPVQHARADSTSNLGIVPPDSVYDGHTYGGWSARWWQYVLSQPASSNPLLDATGAGCGVGQSGPVFFLVGSDIGPVNRTQCVVPAGKALFFPLVNGLDVHVPCSALNPSICDTQNTDQLIWNDLENTAGFTISSLYAKIDGVPVSNLDAATTPYRACAGPVSRCSAPSFSLTFPADNFFGIPAGTYSPAVADGVYLLLAPLTPGAHTITFGGTASDFGNSFSQNITYHLTVSS
jgi:hypothetical protein